MVRTNIFAMPVSSIALLLSFAFSLSSALPWTGPEETKIYRAEDFSPRPTNQPEHPGLLVKRDSVPVNVCGWIGGRPESVARCGSGSSCVHDTMHGFIGCCATAGPCTDGVYTTCIDSGMAGWKSEPGLINNGVLSCRASSTCFQNTFPGNYKQYSCGESNLGGTIQTTFDGQAKDMRLQVVYTGVNFSPVSRQPIQTVPFTPEPTPPEAGKANPTSEAPEATSTSSAKDETSGYIAGGTVGGVAVAAILVAGLVLFLRRRRRMGHKVGGLVSLHHRPQPPSAAGPLKRLTKLYSPSDFGPLPRRSTAQEAAYMSPNPNSSEERSYLDQISEDHGTTYVSPLTGHPDESHAPPPQMREQHITVDRDLLMLNSPMSASTYNSGFPEMDSNYDSSVPISRLNVHHQNSGQNSQSQSPQLLPSDEHSQQRQPLVGMQIDDFGSPSHASHTRTWSSTSRGGGGGGGEAAYGNLNQQQQQGDTHIHNGDMPEMMDIGLIGTMRRAASQMVKGNSRTQDKNARSESMRRSNPFSDEHAVDGRIWESAPMNAPVLKEPEGFGLGLGFGNWGGIDASSSQNAEPGSAEVEKESTAAAEAKHKVERPLMEQMMEAFNAAARGVGGNNDSPSVSSTSVASKYGGMYVVPEEGEGSNVGGGSSVGAGAAGGSSRGVVRSETVAGHGAQRVQSNAGLLRKPVGGSVGHRLSRSEI